MRHVLQKDCEIIFSGNYSPVFQWYNLTELTLHMSYNPPSLWEAPHKMTQGLMIASVAQYLIGIGS